MKSSRKDDRDVADALRADVLDGKLVPGDRLVETQLAERYAVGRAAVRAAIGELTKEGLVEREPHRGARVRKVNLVEAIRITEVRGLLEGFLAARAAQAITPEQHPLLLSIIDEMRLAVDGDQLVRYGEMNARLHRTIRQLSGHEVGAEIVENVLNRMVHFEFSLGVIPGRVHASLDEHVEIVDAIVSGDADRAAWAMRSHIGSVLTILKRRAQLELAVTQS
jgi:DNA-binding GntR family transcriptional regulator